MLVALVAWLFVTNRCGLAFVGPEAAAAEMHRCCQPESPAEKAPAGNTPLCCQSLAVTLAENGELESFHPPLVPVTWLVPGQWEVTELEPRMQSWTTGPPDAPPFLAVVLKSSLQAHGPPALS